MELFDEVYGVYYAAVAHVLASAPLTKAQLRRLLCRELSVDGAQEVEDKLLDGTWPLLREKDGKLYSALRFPPSQPLSYLECAYLTSIADDPRAALFLSDAQLDTLRQALGDTAPLYAASDFDFYDRFSDGDELLPAYRERFSVILKAFAEEGWLDFDYLSRKGKQMHFICKPLILAYSGKDNRFRLHGVNRDGVYLTLNLSFIREIRVIEPPARCAPVPEALTQPLCKEPVTVEVSSERSALTRFMLEFSYLEKKSELSADGQTATVRLWYPKADETEILIRLLSFGPVIRIVSPAPFVAQVKERIRRQSGLLNP